MFKLNIVLDCNPHDASGLFMGHFSNYGLFQQLWAVSAIMIKDKLLFSKEAKFMPYSYFVNNVVSICLFANLFTPGFIFTLII